MTLKGDEVSLAWEDVKRPESNENVVYGSFAFWAYSKELEAIRAALASLERR
ncbi:MAG: hypothetical protein MUC92_00925 [Fimbriimonadaceae bacterium]|nr:hypothetical protein [Fimbriimonadaceae bacterium]